MPANHGLTGDAQCEGVFRGFVTNGFDVNGNAAFRFLLATFSQTGGYGTKERNIHGAAPEFLKWGDDAEGACLPGFGGERSLLPQQSQVLGHRVQAPESKLAGNLLK